MSVGYRAVQWSKPKRRYDAVVLGAVGGYLCAFIAVGRFAWPNMSSEILAMRALGSCAIVLVHVTLSLGPLARLDRRFLPLVFNRRHLGVVTFLVALVHGAIALVYYHGFGALNPLVSLLSIGSRPFSVSGAPFQLLGAAALLILFFMAATSHDFWLKNLSAVWWKRLHMAIYGAYILIVAHVGLGALQGDRGVIGFMAMGAGVAVVSALHLAAAAMQARLDRPAAVTGDWIDAGPAMEIPPDRARIVRSPKGESIAVFRYEGRVSAITNRCAHQGGPLGEGKVIDGCVTCPWHGWQYRPGDGCSPPPFQERIATYPVRFVKGRVEVSTAALPPGTPTPPALIDGEGGAA